jgi:hypothetical protein
LLSDEVSAAQLAQQWSLDEAIMQGWLAEQARVRVVSPDLPPQLRIPVFDPQAMARLAPVCDAVAEDITQWLREDTELEALLAHCSFAHCPRRGGLCMLWHNSYYAATDRLIAEGVIPPFPAMAEGEWGVWLTSHLYGRERPDAARVP